MNFKIISLSACGGGNHLHIRVQRVPNGRMWDVPINKKDVVDTDEIREKKKERLAVARIISAVRESGETTPAGIRTFLLNKEFDL